MSTPDCNLFSATLRAARKGRTQADFARFLELPNQQRLDRYERGVNLPDVVTAYKIALRLGVTVEEMLTDPTCIDRGTSGLPDIVRLGGIMKTASFEDVRTILDRLTASFEPGKFSEVMGALLNDSGIQGTSRMLLLTYMLEEKLKARAQNGKASP